MAHWIIDDRGFGGQYYTCSNCGESWNDIFYEVSSLERCPECDEIIYEDATEYVITKKDTIEEAKICAAKKAELSRQWLLNVMTEKGLMGVYNLGLEHMYKYLKEKDNEKTV